ncbi:MAG: hydroxymethylbilane synthase [Chloroflexota bacterium]
MSELRVLRLATRGSVLALIQSGWVAGLLERAAPGLRVEMVRVLPPGDQDKQTPLTVLGKGVFVKGVEELLLRGGADIAVHSLKDVPTDETPGLCLGAFPPSEDPRDAVICRAGLDFDRLPIGATIGTGSPRRAAQLLALRADLQIKPIRGNLDTRIRRLHEGHYDAVVVAVAGVARLDRRAELTRILEVDECTPAVGQGALGVQCRSGDAAVRDLLAAIDDPACRARSLAERELLRVIDGGCRIPAGAVAQIRGDTLDLVGVVASPDGRSLDRRRTTAPLADPIAAGRALAELLMPAANGLLAAGVARP